MSRWFSHSSANVDDATKTDEDPLEEDSDKDQHDPNQLEKYSEVLFQNCDFDVDGIANVLAGLMQLENRVRIRFVIGVTSLTGLY